MTEKEEREKELDDALLDILNKGLIQVLENEDHIKGNFDCRKGYVPRYD